MSESRAEHFWKRRALVVCLKHNAAVWLAGWLPVILAASMAAVGAILVLRRREAGLEVVWAGLAATFFASAPAIAWLKRKDFFRMADGLVRLESTLGLHSRLTAAAAGVGSWPEPQRAASDRWQWCWGRALSQAGAAAAMICVAAVLPLPTSHSSPKMSRTPPVAWTEIETWIDALKMEDIVEPDSLENLRGQLGSLRDQDPESWYDHASLEAGDSLHAETAQAVRDLQQNLQAAADIAGQLLASSDQGISDRELQAMSQELSEALKNMASGRLPLDADLLKKLQKLDPKSLKPLSPDQLAQLQKQLQQGSGVCKKCLGDGQEGEMMTLQEGQARTGKGGLGGGGGPAPLTAKAPTDLHTKTTDTISNDDISRALPGEVVALSKSEHQIEKNLAPPAGGGQIAGPGQGGEAAWKDSLTPQERAAAARFFQ